MRKKYFDRRLLPTPAEYYSHELPHLNLKRTASNWVNVQCCFHDDKQPSLGIHLVSGGFHCFSCGAKGGDIVAFHRQRYQMSFIETVTFFGAWVYER